jgi:hypothetical protein
MLVALLESNFFVAYCQTLSPGLLGLRFATLFFAARDQNAEGSHVVFVCCLDTREFLAIVRLALIILELKKKMAQEELELGRSLSLEEREDRLELIMKNARDLAETEKATSALLKCPFCQAPYMKIDGCEHMKCGRCKKYFNDPRTRDELGHLRCCSKL